MGFHSQEWCLTDSVPKPKFKPSSTDHPTFNCIIHSLSRPNNWVAMTNPPTIFSLWLVKRQHQIYDFDIKACHLIRKTLFDWQKWWLQRTRQLFSSWMRCSIRTGKLISFLKESCFFCDFHWFGLVNKISVRWLVFREVLQVLWESNEEARRRFFRRIFGILWETFNFNLIFLSGLMKKYHSFQFSGYILKLMWADHHTTYHVFFLGMLNSLC